MVSRGRSLAGPPNVNLGPPDISETTTARKLNLKIQLDMIKYPLYTKIIVLYDTTWKRPPYWFSTRDRPKFDFGCGFGAETDLKCSFCSVSVTVTTHHFTFGFGSNYIRQTTEIGRNCMEWVKLMEDLRHGMGLRTLHRKTNFELKL